MPQVCSLSSLERLVNDREHLEEFHGHSVRRSRQYGGSAGAEREGMGEGGGQNGERPGPHVKVITQTHALTQHFSQSKAHPPSLLYMCFL